ncbi:patatin-like phospholipase family protein [Rhizobium bangladeshense]|uniref:Patatin-like phospholipase family protein n=2 Tax=Rhizobium bangladeshense TaxID=1138189 RepID=A0ABS7LFB4_9HYPH|nr:patatin-like phospholipase family protein [Rhizobium bangladeshense]MBX4865770.1 alpha/beta hydrolase [Rhizobium bangladeshense]MBX4872342.1 alpha/beta hydrolase [Rhizobium bangladeshense]MBX4882351.1 alpha/beta hydrolase [Rhizobium bangladeshense]MBX4898493.1 alpha/beta hydrolase [Rhizobium bangladeshense]MBX4902884.1 alpha/beta hydrolase [Rhizobium bangladeshense]
MAILTLAFLAGCMAPDRVSYSPTAAANANVEGFGDIRTYADTGRQLPDAPAWLAMPRHKDVNYLVLSGGGAGGAFSVGVLKAWSDSKERPEFDIVSGVSTGALIAPLAFLGPAYDDTLVDLYTSGAAKELVDADFLPKTLLGPSLLKQEPLRRMVERHLTQEMLEKIAAEHRKGRRLLVLTSNLDSQRPVVWNMGAIADSGRPDALKLFRDVIIASASIPGVFPAVLIRVKANGEEFEEMHSDGGSSSQILTIPEGWMASPRQVRWPKGLKLNMYVIVNNALVPEFSTTTNNTLAVMARASAALIKSQTRSALVATYVYAQKNGIRFRVASIDRQIPYKITDPFNTNYMRAVYHLGYAEMASGRLWKDQPVFADLAAADPPQSSQ